ncbi:MAG: PCRF domain-containing protein, partial [Actinomycetota bacterium]|nr:PCRF domain-containing protein [Actinomycetota bacterium]
MFDRLKSVEDEFVSLEASLSDPELASDQPRMREITRRYKDLTPVVDCVRRYHARAADAQAARELLAVATADERPALDLELSETEAELSALEEELRLLMLPKDPNDGRAVIMEIRGAEGGEEANLFARDLYDMYRSYASAKGWTVEVLDHDDSDLGGINQVTMLVNGDTAWSRL